mmetsp:Transcript_32576/g.69855  ORF Transcript_32576/g.69855 Transcript_32576/m.69855 type:complete len:262 (+) Transcript_32576:1247-2032(+)
MVVQVSTRTPTAAPALTPRGPISSATWTATSSGISSAQCARHPSTSWGSWMKLLAERRRPYCDSNKRRRDEIHPAVAPLPLPKLLQFLRRPARQLPQMSRHPSQRLLPTGRLTPRAMDMLQVLPGLRPPQGHRPQEVGSPPQDDSRLGKAITVGKPPPLPPRPTCQLRLRSSSKLFEAFSRAGSRSRTLCLVCSKCCNTSIMVRAMARGNKRKQQRFKIKLGHPHPCRRRSHRHSRQSRSSHNRGRGQAEEVTPPARCKRE